MACIKPPAKVTKPQSFAGPTLDLAKIDPIQTEVELTEKGGIRGLHHVTPDKLVMHIRNPDAHEYNVTELAVDMKTGTVRADLHIKGAQGKDHAKASGKHTFTNPALSQLQAKAELWSAYNDPNATEVNGIREGVSQSGVTYSIRNNAEGQIHGHPVAPNLD